MPFIFPYEREKQKQSEPVQSPEKKREREKRVNLEFPSVMQIYAWIFEQGKGVISEQEYEKLMLRNKLSPSAIARTKYTMVGSGRCAMADGQIFYKAIYEAIAKKDVDALFWAEKDLSESCGKAKAHVRSLMGKKKAHDVERRKL